MSLSYAMVGAGGRMGRAIIALAQSFEGGRLSLCGALEAPDSPVLGRDAGRLSGTDELGIRVSAEPNEALQKAQVVIDFSSPLTSLKVAEFCIRSKIPCVIGTTGFSDEQREKLQQAAQHIPLLLAANMSLGVNLLFYLVRQSGRLLGPGFDVEICEAHHRYKKDAPSGTALALRDALKDAPYYQNSRELYGRQGIVGERPSPREEIGIHALRGGDVVGEHSVFFLGEGERLELKHSASSRTAFASGALRSALFLIRRQDKPKMYKMDDVLGLTEAS